MLVVIDIGGTNTRVAVSEDGKIIKNKKKFPTPIKFEEGISSIITTVNELSGNNSIDGLAVGIPGTINRSTGKVINVANIHSWNNRDICNLLSQKLETNVFLANDAELAALGEASFGAGKNSRIVAYLTVSTGIGGALVVDKNLVPRAYNTEPGHMVVDVNSEAIDGSERKGTLEVLASGITFEKQFGVKPKNCENPEIWEQYAQILGEGIINVILLWSPEILVIGGGLSKKGDLFFNPLKKFVSENLNLFPSPLIVPAELGDDAGIYGGLALLKEKRKT